jgi:PucR C-terminal helix-turn-helix domain
LAPDTRLSATFDELVDALKARVDDTVAILMRRMREHYPDEAIGDPVVEERIREFSVASILAEYEAFRAGALPETAPPTDAFGTRANAQLGIPLDWILTGFRVGHRCHWEAWMDLVERSVQDADARRELLNRGSKFFFDYVDRLSALLTEEYEREREQVQRKRAGQRTVLVHQLLNGAEHDSETIGWPLEHHHLGMLAWGETPDRTIEELGRALGRPVLVVESGMQGTRFGWASGAGPLGRAEERMVSSFKPSHGQLALGLEAAGADGFVLTNRQSRRAGWVAWSTDDPVTRFRDVALEALAVEDEDSARAFVAAEICGFDDHSARSQRLRETLRAYFSADQNAAAAAASLGVHQQTVANRIKAVEELLGSTVGARRGELELALRLHRCFTRTPPLPANLIAGDFG